MKKKPVTLTEDQTRQALMIIGLDEKKRMKFLEDMDRELLLKFSSMTFNIVAHEIQMPRQPIPQGVIYGQGYPYGVPNFCNNCGYNLKKSLQDSATSSNRTLEEAAKSLHFCGGCGASLRQEEQLPKWAALMKEAFKEMKKET